VIDVQVQKTHSFWHGQMPKRLGVLPGLAGRGLFLHPNGIVQWWEFEKSVGTIGRRYPRVARKHCLVRLVCMILHDGGTRCSGGTRCGGAVIRAFFLWILCSFFFLDVYNNENALTLFFSRYDGCEWI